MYPKKNTGLVGRFIIVCFLLLSCVYNVGNVLMYTCTNSIPLTHIGGAPGDNQPNTEEETHLVRVSSEQQICQSPVRATQKQERQRWASVNGPRDAMQDRIDVLLAGQGLLEEPYYYIFLFRHNLF